MSHRSQRSQSSMQRSHLVVTSMKKRCIIWIIPRMLYGILQGLNEGLPSVITEGDRGWRPKAFNEMRLRFGNAHPAMLQLTKSTAFWQTNNNAIEETHWRKHTMANGNALQHSFRICCHLPEYLHPGSASQRRYSEITTQTRRVMRSKHL